MKSQLARFFFLIKIEVATGRHPYSEISGGPIMLTAHIADEEPPSLDPTKFGEHFCDFIKIW